MLALCFVYIVISLSSYVMLFEYVHMLCGAAIKGHCSLHLCLIWTYHISLSQMRIHEFILKTSLLWRDTVVRQYVTTFQMIVEPTKRDKPYAQRRTVTSTDQPT